MNCIDACDFEMHQKLDLDKKTDGQMARYAMKQVQ